MAKPGTYSPTFTQGDDWQLVADLSDQAGEPLDLTGYTWLAQARTGPAAATEAFEFTVDTTDAATGTIVLECAAATTATIGPGRYVWDLQWTDGTGKVLTVLAGTITVRPEVSRP